MEGNGEHISPTTTKSITSRYTTVHPLGDVAALHATTVEIQQHRQQKDQFMEQNLDAPCPDEHAGATAANNRCVLGHKGRPHALHSEAVRNEVLATYSITRSIHSFIVFGEDDEDESFFSEQVRAHAHADRLEAAEIRRTRTLFHPYRVGSENSSLVGGGRGSQLCLVTVVEDLHQQLKDAWSAGEKVRSLRIAICAARMLSKVLVPSCYPSVYVLVARVLDTFGDLVAQRLQSTAAEKSYVVATLLKKGIDASEDIIPAESVEMCYNWFLKINSIRELLPRVCIELSLLKCFRYMGKKTRVVSEAVVRRLAMQIRGIADPLVASHLRWYLSARAMGVLSKPGWATASALDQAVLDTLEALEHLSPVLLEQLQGAHDLGRLDYFDLFIPVLQWQLDIVVRYGDPLLLEQRGFLKEVVNVVVERLGGPSPLLLCLWRAFSAEALLSWYSMEDLFCMTLRSLPTRMVSRLNLLKELCLSLAKMPVLPIPRARCVALLSAAWDFVLAEWNGVRHVANVEDVTCAQKDITMCGELLAACGALMQFSAVHMGWKQVSVLLGFTRDIIGDMYDMSRSGLSDIIATNLFDMLSALILVVSPSLFLESEHFMLLVQKLTSPSRRQLACTLLQLIASKSVNCEEALPPLTTEKLLQVCRMLHDDLPGASKMVDVQEEMHMVEKVFLQKLEKMNSSEEALQFMCDARRLLPRIDAVRSVAITRALGFADGCAASYSQGKKRGAIKAFLTFCMVTVPALTNPIERLHLSVLTSGVAFRCGMIVIGEKALDFALETLEAYSAGDSCNIYAEEHSRGENGVAEVAVHLLEVGIAAPAKGEHLRYVKRVLEWCASFDWMPLSLSYGRVVLSALWLTARASQGMFFTFPLCRTERYSKDPAFVKASAGLCTEAAEQLLRWLQNSRSTLSTMPVESKVAAVSLATMALEIFESTAVAIGSSHLVEGTLTSLSRAAWQVANEWSLWSGSLDLSRHIVRSAQYVQQKVDAAVFNAILSCE